MIWKTEVWMKHTPNAYFSWSVLVLFPRFSVKGMLKESTYSVGDLGSIPGLGRSLEEEKATHSSILA